MRILCVLLPHFPLMCEALRNPALEGHPAIATYTSGSHKLVLDWSPGLEGLQRNMPLQQALARHGEVELLQADIPRYRAVFNELLDALEEKSPLVEGPEPGLVYIGVDGLHLLYPNDDALLKAIHEAIPETFVHQIGIAGNKFLAHLAARLSPSKEGHRVLSGDDVATFLKDLPCDILPVSLKSRSKLHDFGVHTLGQLATLPPGPLQSQFGPEGKRIWELARGIDDTPLYPRFMERAIEESTVLPSVTVSLDAILVETELLLVRVFANIGRNGLGISSLTLWTRTWSAESWERTIQFKEPAMEMRAAVARIKRILEDYPQPGPVEQVGIRVNRLGYPQGRQRSLFSEVRAKASLIEDIKQLELRLGNPQVYKVKEVEPWSRIPERRYALTPTGR
jgi:DNA polymerase-4